MPAEREEPSQRPRGRPVARKRVVEGIAHIVRQDLHLHEKVELRLERLAGAVAEVLGDEPARKRQEPRSDGLVRLVLNGLEVEVGPPLSCCISKKPMEMHVSKSRISRSPPRMEAVRLRRSSGDPI
jgi:hypothetical protein